MNDEMREAFCNWLETEHGVKPIEGIAIDALANMTNPQLFAGFQAAYQLQQTKLDKAVSALEEISKGVDDRAAPAHFGKRARVFYQDSQYRAKVAQQTLAEIKESK